MSTLQRLTDRGLVKPPRWLPANVQYETIMGSVAYGVSSDTSDVDVYAWAIPPKEDIFPHLRGEVPGFGRQHKRFAQFQEHHVRDVDALAGHGRTYDLTVFGIVKFFALAMENNPNVIDSLFTPDTCVLHSTRVGNHVRENRRLFLHRGAWPKFKGYAYSQLHKLAIKEPVGKRAESGRSPWLRHQVRLPRCSIARRGRADSHRRRYRLAARQRSAQGDPPRRMAEARLRQWAAGKEADLERAYAASKLPVGPDEDRLRMLLLECLEEHYGSLAGCIVQPDRAVAALRAVQAELDKVRELL